MKSLMQVDIPLLVSYDELGGFVMNEVVEITNFELSSIAGGFLDGGCGGNKVCFNTYNQYCVNTNLCLDNAVCAGNAVC